LPETGPVKKHRLLFIPKGGGFKALCASYQSIADLLKKKMVAYDFIPEISFHFPLG